MLIDMEAVEEPLRETEDGIEKMRDPSHVRNLSENEMLALYDSGLSVSCCEVTKMPVVLQSWLEHTKAPPEIQAQIKDKMLDEMNGGGKTGLAPYVHKSALCFDQRWVLLIGKK